MRSWSWLPIFSLILPSARSSERSDASAASSGLGLLHLDIDALFDLGLNVLGHFFALFDQRLLVFFAAGLGIGDMPALFQPRGP